MKLKEAESFLAGSDDDGKHMRLFLHKLQQNLKTAQIVLKVEEDPASMKTLPSLKAAEQALGAWLKAQKR